MGAPCMPSHVLSHSFAKGLMTSVMALPVLRKLSMNSTGDTEIGSPTLVFPRTPTPWNSQSEATDDFAFGIVTKEIVSSDAQVYSSTSGSVQRVRELGHET